MKDPFDNKIEINKEKSEADTRKIIDQKLRDVGWEVDSQKLKWSNGIRPEKGRNLAISEVPMGNGKADYALFIGKQLVGVIEAKRFDQDVSGVFSQAKEYARNIKEGDDYELVPDLKGEYRIPFLYTTNGREYEEKLEEKSGIWFWDSRIETQRNYPLHGWHSPSDLERKLEVNQEEAEKELAEQGYPEIANRKYQIEGIKAIEEALSKNQRRMLLCMATGTGKTRLAISLMYRLLKAKRVRRILFLVDRICLGEQVMGALEEKIDGGKSFHNIYEVQGINDKEKELGEDVKLSIATVQGMYRRLFLNEGKSKFSVGTYDFIIADEVHRGYREDESLSESEWENSEQYTLSNYLKVLDYFDASILGLTATPTNKTKEIFKGMNYIYSYEKAVKEEYLVAYETILFKTKLSEEGVTIPSGKVNVLKENNVEEIEIEKSLRFHREQFNKRVIVGGLDQTILEELVSEYIDPRSNGKTLIFANDDQHADRIVNLLKKILIEHKVEVSVNEAVVKITYNNKDRVKDISRFKNEQYPNIVVTVDLLTTGVDVPKIENLVFLRYVGSQTLFYQMLGRGTRKCEEISKEYFRVFDVFDNVQRFEEIEDIAQMNPRKTTTHESIRMLYRETLEAQDDHQQFQELKEKLVEKIKNKSHRLKQEDKLKIEKSLKVDNLDQWIDHLNTLTPLQLEKEASNIKEISDYRISQKEKYISNEKDGITETIKKSWSENNSSDYLEKFRNFLEENKEKEIIEKVIKHPYSLNYKDYKWLKSFLEENLFDKEKLKKAIGKGEDFQTNIISLINHVHSGVELVDDKERIDKAMEIIYEMQEWTPKQKKIIDDIKKRFLAMRVLAPTAEKYFNEGKYWEDKGRYKGIKKVFGPEIDTIIETINQQLYSSK